MNKAFLWIKKIHQMKKQAPVLVDLTFLHMAI